MKNKPPLNLEETLRLAGIDSEAMPEWISKINEGKNLLKTQENFSSIKELLNNAWEFADVNCTYPIEQIKKINSIVEEMISPDLETQEEILADIMYRQANDKRPETKFLLEMNRAIQYKTYGLKNGFYVISADSHIGKTGWTIQLAMDVLLSNEKSNIIFITLDDSKREIMNRMICAIAYRVIENKMDGERLNTKNIPEINCVPSAYSYWDDQCNCFIKDETTEQIKKHSTAIFHELGYIKQRIHIFEGKHTMDSIENIIYKNKKNKTLVIIDAIYNVEGFKNDYEQDAKLSLFLKLLPVKYGVTVIAIKEISKKQKTKGSQIDDVGERKKENPDIGDTKGSVIWEYNSTAMATLYEQQKKICINFQKNKAGGRRFVKYYEQDYLKNAYRELQVVIKRSKDHDD